MANRWPCCTRQNQTSVKNKVSCAYITCAMTLSPLLLALFYLCLVPPTTSFLSFPSLTFSLCSPFLPFSLPPSLPFPSPFPSLTFTSLFSHLNDYNLPRACFNLAKLSVDFEFALLHNCTNKRCERWEGLGREGEGGEGRERRGKEGEGRGGEGRGEWPSILQHPFCSQCTHWSCDRTHQSDNLHLSCTCTYMQNRGQRSSSRT